MPLSDTSHYTHAPSKSPQDAPCTPEIHPCSPRHPSIPSNPPQHPLTCPCYTPPSTLPAGLRVGAGVWGPSSPTAPTPSRPPSRPTVHPPPVFDREIVSEMGALGVLGPTIKGEGGCRGPGVPLGGYQG
uniref:Uncharacterized protein n=1 Tax=Buteo japonicus TaxID=224669 RepID=A0A8C0HQ38_9AVES